MTPPKLNKGDEIRIIAPSGSLTRVRKDVLECALACLDDNGFKVTYSTNCREMDRFSSSSVESRVADLHEAFDVFPMVSFPVGGRVELSAFLDRIDLRIIEH